ncbi:hypothetical protein [Thermoleptolyngbya oregonensis]|nr:hypothetical protein [Thermoleptolyngbya oregonensis]
MQAHVGTLLNSRRFRRFPETVQIAGGDRYKIRNVAGHRAL